VAVPCSERRRFLAALAKLWEKAEGKPVEGTLLAWPASDEGARWVVPGECWVHCFEPGHSLRPPEDEELVIRLIGELAPSQERVLTLKLANGATTGILPPADWSLRKAGLGLGEIAEVVLEKRNLYKKGLLRAKQVRRARGKAKLEFLRLRSLTERPVPALRVEGNEEFAINYSDVVLVHGKPKAGKTRALLALFADSEPTEEGLRVHRKLRATGQPRVYYLSHITETPLPRLREFAKKMGWSPDRAEEFLYPFEDPEDLEEFLKDPDIPENSFIIVDSLVKLFPRGVTGESENDALQVEKALAPLIQAARRRGHLLILVHHQAKRSDDPRGSSAIQALPDHLIGVREIKWGMGLRRVMEYQRGRATVPHTPLLTINEELPQATEAGATAPRVRQKHGAPAKYEKLLEEAMAALKRRKKFELMTDEGGNTRPFFEERELIKELKRIATKKKLRIPTDEKSLRDVLRRYAGMGRNARKFPSLVRVEQSGQVHYAALEETGAPSRARSPASNSRGKKSS